MDFQKSELFTSTCEKSYADIYHSHPHISVITQKILIAIMRFARYYLLFATNSTFMNDSMYVGTI